MAGCCQDFLQRSISRCPVTDTAQPLKNHDRRSTKRLDLVGEVETARGQYIAERGESQEATLEKDQAFAQIDDWMSDFFAVDKLALEEKPQLLESLGKLVRS